MSKENTALAIFNAEATSIERKKAIYNLTVNAETRLSEKLNQVVEVAGFGFTECEVTNKETGELEPRERLLVIDKDGATYHSVATGLVNSFKNIGRYFAEENNGFFTINPALPVEIKSKTTNKGHTYIAVVK